MAVAGPPLFDTLIDRVFHLHFAALDECSVEGSQSLHSQIARVSRMSENHAEKLTIH